MTKKIISKIAAITAATVLSAIPAAAYDDSFTIDIDDTDCIYCPEYTSANVDVYTDDDVVDPDRDGFLYFYICNRSDRTIAVPSPVSEQCFVQLRTSEGWVTVYGSDNSITPYYDTEIDSCYGDVTYLSPYMSMKQSMDVSDYDDGDYRLGFYTDIWDLHYVHFTVRRNVSAVLADSRIYSGENELDVRISNNLPYDVELNLDPSLTVLEKFSGGKWKTVEPDEYPEYFEDPVLPAYGSDSFDIDLGCFGELSKGEYRLTFDWNAYFEDDPWADPDVYGTCKITFKVVDPVSISIIPMSVSSRTDLTARIKITNNTDSRIYVKNYGRLQKKSGSKWVNVSFKSGAGSISNSRSIAAGKTAVLELKLSDYYYIKPLNSNEYRMEIPVNGRSYYCNFTVTRDNYYSIK